MINSQRDDPTSIVMDFLRALAGPAATQPKVTPTPEARVAELEAALREIYSEHSEDWVVRSICERVLTPHQR